MAVPNVQHGFKSFVTSQFLNAGQISLEHACLWLKQEFHGPTQRVSIQENVGNSVILSLTRIDLISPIDFVNFKIDQNGWVGGLFLASVQLF